MRQVIGQACWGVGACLIGALVFVGPLERAHSDNASELLLVSGATAATYSIAGGNGTAKLLHNATTGSNEAALSELTLAVGTQIPEHKHPSSAEFLYVLSGQVELTIAGKQISAGAGDCVRIPANTLHSAKVLAPAPPNSSANPMFKALQVYAGPGPEQRFTKGKRIQ